MVAPIDIGRADWPAVVDAFRAFFDGLDGTVREAGNEIEFNAGYTGLAIHRNGTSRSFMPLHGLDAAWDTVVFDRDSYEVTLVGGTTRYVYRVPPGLQSAGA
jgi:hypothetical protein